VVLIPRYAGGHLEAFAYVRQHLHRNLLDRRKVLDCHGIVVSERFAEALILAQVPKMEAGVKFEDEEIVHAKFIE
jgi:hypothetical protein